MRLQALEARIDADLHLGRHAHIIAALEILADLHHAATGGVRDRLRPEALR
jgi:hypothetical protein